MKNTITLFALSLLLTGCHKATSDDVISHQVVGSWADTRDKTPFTISSNGSYSIVVGQVNHAGTWQIRDGVFIMTHTNLDHAVERLKIVRVDDHQIVFGDEKSDKTLTIAR
jgi:hypothetical protein